MSESEYEDESEYETESEEEPATNATLSLNKPKDDPKLKEDLKKKEELKAKDKPSVPSKSLPKRAGSDEELEPETIGTPSSKPQHDIKFKEPTSKTPVDKKSDDKKKPTPSKVPDKKQGGIKLRGIFCEFERFCRNKLKSIQCLFLQITYSFTQSFV